MPRLIVALAFLSIIVLTGCQGGIVTPPWSPQYDVCEVFIVIDSNRFVDTSFALSRKEIVDQIREQAQGKSVLVKLRYDVSFFDGEEILRIQEAVRQDITQAVPGSARIQVVIEPF